MTENADPSSGVPDGGDKHATPPARGGRRRFKARAFWFIALYVVSAAIFGAVIYGVRLAAEVAMPPPQ